MTVDVQNFMVIGIQTDQILIKKITRELYKDYCCSFKEIGYAWILAVRGQTILGVKGHGVTSTR